MPKLVLPVRVLPLALLGALFLLPATPAQDVAQPAVQNSVQTGVQNSNQTGVQGAAEPAAANPAAPAQTDTPPAPRPIRRSLPKPPTAAQSANMILLDPAHGGTDSGAHFGDLLEKDLTLAFAARLRPMLAAQGFTVVMTREIPDTAPAADANTPTQTVTEDQRTEQANRLHPLLCLLLHATNGGHGVHLFTSALRPAAIASDPHAIVPWDTAQASALTESLRLATDLSTAMNGSRIPLVLGRASVPPIDTLTCPAIAVEIAPLTGGRIDDAAYQDRIARAVTDAVTFYRGHTETEAARAAAAEQAAAQQAKEQAARSAPTPGTSSPPAPKPVIRRPKVQPPAPIVRQDPSPSEPPSSEPPAAKPDPPPTSGPPQ